jgi:hypothetical protein
MIAIYALAAIGGVVVALIAACGLIYLLDTNPYIDS